MDADQIPPELAIEGPEPFTLEQLDAVTDLLPEGTPVPEHLCDTFEAVQRFEVHDDGAAEWCMAHVAAIDTNLAELKAQRQAYIARIDRWHSAAVVRLGGRRGFFAAHLERYAAAFRARDPKRNKTLHLASGVVKSSEAQPKAAVLQPEQLVAWALANMSDEDVAAVVKMEPLVSELRKRTKIVVRPIGYVVTLECGHEHHVPVINPATGAPHTPDSLRADGMTCDQCDPDPIDGWLHRSVTAVGDWDERVVVMPVDTDDGPKVIDVAGATVDPGGVTFSVVTK
jgi:hypothetical protein